MAVKVCTEFSSLLYLRLLTLSLPGVGFKAAESSLESYDDGDGGMVVRLDFTHRHAAWKTGQHFFLCFPDLHIWQSHPFTPASTSSLATESKNSESREQRHVYIIRCLGGETSKLGSLMATKRKEATENQNITTPVILTGPFGLGRLEPGAQNILAVAGGTGISFALPIVMEAIERSKNQTGEKSAHGKKRTVELAWVIRRGRNVEWSWKELEYLLNQETGGVDLRIRIFVTRDADPEAAAPVVEEKYTREKEVSVTQDISSPSTSLASRSTCKASALAKGRGNVLVEWLGGQHPCMSRIVDEFMQGTTGGRTQVVGSGPEGLGRDLRAAVAGVNDGGAVWRGEEKWDAGFDWDNRFF